MAKMNSSKFYKINLITTIACLIPMIIGAVFYSQLPDIIPIHFDVQNQPDNYASKPVALFGLPLLLMVLHIVLCIKIEADPRTSNSSEKLQYLMRFIIPVTGILVQSLVILYVLNDGIEIGNVITIFVGIIFLVVGNYLPKCKQSYTLGIRLPWTLADEDNWNKTHRMAGALWVVLSVLILICTIAGYPQTILIFFALSLFLPIIYSYLLAKNRRNKK